MKVKLNHLEPFMLNNLIDHKLKSQIIFSLKKHAEQKAYILFRTYQYGRRTNEKKGCTLLMADKLG